MKRILRPDQNGLSQLDILLDETLCDGEILIPLSLIRDAGGINKKLKAKQKYELLLRILEKHSILLEDAEYENIDEQILTLTDDDMDVTAQYGWQTDCYVIGKYSRLLQANGYFNAAVEGILTDANAAGRSAETVAYLEKMIGHTDAYYSLDDATKPILIYKGDSVCHNILTIFAEQFGAALEQAGESVVYFDTEAEGPRNLIRLKGNHYKAIIGMQSYCFSIKMEDGVHYLHEYIYGPKYNFVFDHPIFFKQHLMHNYQDFYVLTHDQTYVAFLKKYYKKNAHLFPPAGMIAETTEEIERIYDITFVGAYVDYQLPLGWIGQQPQPIRSFANRFLLIMRKHPNMTAEDACAETLAHYGIETTEETFLESMHSVQQVIYGVMHYFRHRIMQVILESGIQINVFGDSWANCPLRKYPNLICHPTVTVEESLTIWKQSKLSLNIMSWHKGGFTERMAGIMLAGAVLVTDNTQYLAGRYDENDMIIFDLEHIEELPPKIKTVLTDEALQKRIAENGYQKTKANHTWERRAEQFLELLSESS